MRAVILAGGKGTRLSEETVVRPKPMVEIGGKPILWHLMKHLSSHGIDHFVICLGYKGYVIKEWFADYALHTSDVTFDMATGGMTVHEATTEPWKVTLVDTGEETNTGGRLRRIRRYVDGDEAFLMTYGDGLSDVDVTALAAFHREHGRRATVTAVQPAGRFGALEIDGDAVTGFREKPRGDGAWINGGFFVLHPSALDEVPGDDTAWEQGPISALAAAGELRAFRHKGFWYAMDTVRDRLVLEDLWQGGRAPWRTWA
jgi:glucose-1-phosphate cytidylyltransferase